MLKILQSKDPSRNKCKAAACDCLSDIGDNVLQDLPVKHGYLFETILSTVILAILTKPYNCDSKFERL